MGNVKIDSKVFVTGLEGTFVVTAISEGAAMIRPYRRGRPTFQTVNLSDCTEVPVPATDTSTTAETEGTTETATAETTPNTGNREVAA